MNKEDLIRKNAAEIARQLCNRIYSNECNKETPPPAWENITENRSELIENIVELYKHSRKNKVLLEYLNMFVKSEMI